MATTAKQIVHALFGFKSMSVDPANPKNHLSMSASEVLPDRSNLFGVNAVRSEGQSDEEWVASVESMRKALGFSSVVFQTKDRKGNTTRCEAEIATTAWIPRIPSLVDGADALAVLAPRQ